MTLKESGAVFHFNFAQVYWNSRLQMEHSRIIQIIRDTALVDPTLPAVEKNKPWFVADMMAGVGPFAVPLAMTNLPSAMSNPHFDKSQNKDKKNQNKKEKGGEKSGSNPTAPTSSSASRRVIQVHGNGKQHGHSEIAAR